MDRERERECERETERETESEREREREKESCLLQLYSTNKGLPKEKSVCTKICCYFMSSNCRE